MQFGNSEARLPLTVERSLDLLLLTPNWWTGVGKDSLLSEAVLGLISQAAQFLQRW